MKNIPIKPFLYLILLLLTGGAPLQLRAQGWQWAIGNKGGLNDAWPVATDPAGNVFAAGTNQSGGDNIIGGITYPNTGGVAIQDLLVKLSPGGVVQWVQGTQNAESWLYNITTDASGNSFIFGSFDATSMQIGGTTLNNPAGNIQYFIAKFNPAGTLLWAVNDGTASWLGQFIGGALILGTGGICTDAAGNVYITSAFTTTTLTIGPYTLTNADPTGSTDDVFVAKYNSAGVLQWATSFGGSESDDAYGITITPAGNVYVTGAFYSPSMPVGSSVLTNASGDPQAYAAEIDPTGNPVWGVGAGSFYASFGAGIIADAAGNVYMTGGFTDDTISFAGVTISRTYPSVDEYLALFLIQISPAHTITWNKTIGSPSSGVYGFSIGLASCGQVWVSGNFSDSGNIDGHMLYAPANSQDPVFIAGYNLSGTVAGFSGLQSGGDDQNGIACDANGNIYICSDFENNILPFTVGPDNLWGDSVTGTSSEYLYVAKYANSVTTDTIRQVNDTSFCNSTGAVLAPPVGYTGPYLWSTGSTAATISIDSSGTYWVLSPGNCGASYLIDTFHVILNSQDTLHNVKDTAVCAGTTLLLQGPPGYTAYNWNTGATSASITNGAAGTLWVACYDSCLMPAIIDTFHVSINARDSSYTANDTTLCLSSALTLNGPSGYLGYQWNTGATTQSITLAAGTSATYWVSCTDSCALPYLVDTFHVSIDSLDLAFSLGRDTFACGPVTLTIPETGVSYLWQNGSTNATYTATQTGNYYATVKEDACTYTDSIQVSIAYLSRYNFDTVVCLDNSFELALSAPNTGNATVTWSNGTHGNVTNVVDTGIYVAYIADSVCTETDTMHITGQYCNCWAFIPNAFTPDGIVDYNFKPIIDPYCNPLNYSFAIYDRWGNQVYATTDPTASWNGIYNGVPAPVDVYMYEVVFWGGMQHRRFFFKGDVTLIR